MQFAITAYEHVGIRVTDRRRATDFYGKLGWREVADLPDASANEMVNDAGVRINLIFNGVSRGEAGNILQDEAVKYPGVTHAAFVVDDLDACIRGLEAEEIVITEGPVVFDERRKTIFIRDPDDNVLEFNELL